MITISTYSRVNQVQFIFITGHNAKQSILLKSLQRDSQKFLLKIVANKVERIVALKETLHPYFKMVASEF